MEQRRPSKRRKHSRSATSSPSPHFPPEVINPLSHPPNLLKQFQLAGLSESEPLPSIPDFPHRPIPPSSQTKLPPHQDEEEEGEEETEEEEEGETSAPPTPSRASSRLKGLQRERRARERNIGPLVAILRRSVESGDLVRARRAFGLLVRSDIYGKRVDLRTEGFWGLGGEILMTTGLPGDVRWGSAANLHGFLRYFEELIQLYPYSRLHPSSLSAADFYPVLFNAEIYNVFAELEMALVRVDGDLLEEDEMMHLDGDGWDGSSGEDRIKAAKDRLRTDALEATRSVVRRMDELMQTRPYNQSVEMMRLRGVTALVMGDLAVPFPPRTEEEEHEGLTRQDVERGRAVKLFLKVEAAGGELDPWLKDVVREGLGEEEE